MENIKAFTREERTAVLKEMGLPAFREKQIFAWICRGAKSWDECTDLSKDLRASLAQRFSWENAEAELTQVSSDGTRKLLIALPDGQKVEAVFMAYGYGNSLCISTQVGCAMGCRFCASTIGGRIRSLKAWEMLEEYVLAVRESGQPVNHIVLMGMGEPFDNYGEVAAFLRLIHDPQGIGLSYRNITLSTCGIVPGIRRFGEEFPQVNLAISLHAPNQAEREKLMPVAKAYPLDELIPACREHAQKTGRRVTFEFALIAGQNDTPQTAKELAQLLQGMLCHVNLIPLNPVTETGMRGTDRKAAAQFRDMLESMGIPATVRRQLGADIDAACGQLRKKYTEKI
ncbi:MAG: 23S rRNA (adenine(2503)-C(2))-methyltransferase RlmN [Firmicutes bacterium]|nr:23S rRNA (adenine(2503)-C(2))-methyltransferase RlmN [Bacillota bacterium]